MAKQDYKRENGLTEQQHVAITLLLTGKSQVDVAGEIGVAVPTVNLWCNKDPLFIATLNSRRQDAHQAVVAELRSLAAEAVAVLRASLKSEDERIRIQAAKTVIKVLDLESIPAPDGATDPEDVAADLRRQDMWKILQQVA